MLPPCREGDDVDVWSSTASAAHACASAVSAARYLLQTNYSYTAAAAKRVLRRGRRHLERMREACRRGVGAEDASKGSSSPPPWSSAEARDTVLDELTFVVVAVGVIGAAGSIALSSPAVRHAINSCNNKYGAGSVMDAFKRAWKTAAASAAR